MKRALVTGAAGFIGRHVLAALDQAGWDVNAFDIYPRAVPGVTFGDARTFFASGSSHYDLVVHAAAVEPHRSAIDNSPLTVGAGNLELDAAMFQWAARTQPGRVIYLSSSAAYPIRLQTQEWLDAYGARRLDEYLINVTQWGKTGDWSPDAIYGWVKMTGEHLAKAYREQGGTVTVCRPFSGYGEDQDERFPFGAFTARAKRRDDPFEVWGDGAQTRDWIHVSDVVGAILAACEHGVDGPLNLCTGRPTSFNELARMFAAEAGYEPQLKHILDAPRGVAYRVGDPTLLRSFYEPRVELEDGIRRALAA